jgi:phage-related protein
MADHNELIALIDSKINAPETGMAESLMGAVSATTPQQSFCTLWPASKPILQLISGILQWIYPAAIPILNGLIAVGDQLYAEGCTIKTP